MSQTILHLDSSILGPSSASRVLSSHVVTNFREKLPAVRVTYRDLAANPIPHLSDAYLAATRDNSTKSLDGALHSDLAPGENVLQEFLSADIVVIGVAFYNFSISSQLKAWIDRIAIAGKTFRYTESGQPEGLAGNKRVFLALRVVASTATARPSGQWNTRKVACELPLHSLASSTLTSSRRKDSR